MYWFYDKYLIFHSIGIVVRSKCKSKGRDEEPEIRLVGSNSPIE